jgi:hypothetical protein
VKEVPRGSHEPGRLAEGTRTENLGVGIGIGIAIGVVIRNPGEPTSVRLKITSEPIAIPKATPIPIPTPRVRCAPLCGASQSHAFWAWSIISEDPAYRRWKQANADSDPHLGRSSMVSILRLE